MGYGSTEERQWMPSVDSFFGADSGTVVSVMPPDVLHEEGVAGSFTIPIGTEMRVDSINSQGTERSLLGNSYSMKSNCLDPPSGDEEHMAHHQLKSSAEIQQLTEKCYQLELENDVFRQLLTNGQNESADITLLANDETKQSIRSKYGTFESLRQIWETQRDILLERLKEKDDVINKQNEQLHTNSRSFKQLAAGIDGLETRFTQAFESERLKVDQFQRKIQERTESLLLLVERAKTSQARMNGDLDRVSTLIRTDMKALSTALEESKMLMKQTEFDKHAALHKLDSTTIDVERLRADVIRLSDSLRTERFKNQQLMEQLDEELAEGMDNVNATEQQSWGESRRISGPSATATPTHQSKSGMDAVMKEKIELERKVLDMREKLVDLKEHSEELESQLLQQRDVFLESRNQIRELEASRRGNQELVTLLAVKQKSINNLKQTLAHIQSVMNRASDTASCVDAELLVEILDLQKRCEDTEALVKTAQTERDISIKEMEKISDAAQILSQELKRTSRLVEKSKKEIVELKKSLGWQRAEVATLQTNLRIETLKNTSHKRKKTGSRISVDSDIMRELLKSKVDLAEMNEVVIRLRREISTSRNNRPCKTKHGYHHFIRKALTDALALTR